MIQIQKPMSTAREISSEVSSDTDATEVLPPDASDPDSRTSARLPDFRTSDPKAKSETVPATAPQSQSQTRRLFDRLRRIKHIEIYLAVIVIAVMVFIFMSTLGSKETSGTSNLTAAEATYVRQMEQKLVLVLSGVRGAGKVSAMVTAVGSSTLEIAYNIDEKTVTQNGSGGTSTTTTTVSKTPILIGGEALVLAETEPRLRGVVIVASGASDPAVRLSLLRAVQTLVSDNSVIIEVLC